MTVPSSAAPSSDIVSFASTTLATRSAATRDTAALRDRATRGHGRRAGGRRHEAGFTLIEILVVVAIIAIFATVVALNVGGEVPKAKVTKAKSDIASIEAALEMYRIDNGYYPSTEQGLLALVEQPATGRVPQHYRAGGYIKRLPLDPWQNEYQYLSPGVHGEIDVFTFGSDGVPGGEEGDADVGNWDLE